MNESRPAPDTAQTAGGGVAIAEPISAEALLQVVRGLCAQLHGAEPEPGAITLHSTLETDLGLDSLARIELLVRLEQRFKVHIPEATAAAAQTLSDLLQAVSAAPARAGAQTAPSAAAAAAPLADVTIAAALAPAHAATLQQVLSWRVERDPTATHLILLAEPGPRSLSYRALGERAAEIARGLQRHGIGPGSTVALMLPTSLEFFYAFFSVLLCGAIPVPIYPPARASQLEEHVHRHALILANAQAEALITVPEAAAVARLLRVRVVQLRHVFSVGDLMRGERSGPPDAADTADLAGAQPEADALAVLQYTSGSTGSPKGVMLTHRQLLANIRAMGRQISASSSDVFVSWLPLYHDMGLIGAWLGSLYFGCRLIIMPPTAFLARPGRWLRTIHDYRGTLSASPNFGYEFAARRIPDSELDGLDLSCWRVAFNGAEPIVADTLEHFQQRFASRGFRAQAMTPVYGLAEAAVGVTFPPPARGPLLDCVDRSQLMRAGRAIPVAPGEPNAQRFVSCGLPLPGYQVRIVDPSGAELPERVEGALQFTGPSATAGYYHNAEANARLKSGIWLDSGDRAYVAGGEVYITGRSKDIIIRRGRHIYPEEIEHVVGDLPGVRRGCVAAFGVVGADATERLVVVAETSLLDAQQRAALTASINARVVDCIGEPAEEILLAPVHSVLKTSSGKLRRAATRAAYQAGSLRRRPLSPTRQLWRLGLESAAPLLRRGGRSAARTAYGLYAWAAFLALALPVISGTALGWRRSAAQAWRLTHQATSRLIRAWRIPLSVQWEAPIDPSTPHVVVANHCSYVDSLFLAALLSTPHSFVARFGLQDLPVLHSYLRRLGTILIERSGPREGSAELQRLKDALAQRRSLVVFPEGTFTRAAGLGPFRLGAFEAATAAGAPVIPVALRGTRSLLRDGRHLPSRVPISIVVGAPLRPPPGDDAFAAALWLRDASRAHILRHSGEPELPQ